MTPGMGPTKGERQVEGECLRLEKVCLGLFRELGMLLPLTMASVPNVHLSMVELAEFLCNYNDELEVAVNRLKSLLERIEL